MLSSGWYLCIPAQEKLVQASEAGVAPPEDSLYSPELGGQTTVETLRQMPGWMCAIFLPLLLEGARLTFASQGEGHCPRGWGWSLRDQRDAFWVQIGRPVLS
jgi:hypothetical protein